MPGESAFSKVFSSAFIINQPVSNVGRNGYWLYQNEEVAFLAVFACAGRGHLASMMTRIYANSLKKLVVDHQVHFPGSILGFIHREIMSKFKERENFILHTGADLCIFKMELASGRIEYAGANIDLIHSKEDGIERIKGDQLSIGPESENNSSFHTRNLEAHSGRFYIYTSGLEKLVVEDNYRKLGEKGVTKILEKTSHLGFLRQKETLTKYFSKWSTVGRKTDDILLLGFSVKEADL